MTAPRANLFLPPPPKVTPAAKPTKKRPTGNRRKRKGLPPFKGTYTDYLSSRQWAKKRRKALAYYGNRCTVCGTTYRLEVHHRHYRTLFKEGWPDLDVLCRGCHENHHEGKNGVVADPMTAEFLALARSF